MTRPALTLALIALATGCPSSEEPPLETPDFVGDKDLNLYLFAHFDAADPVEMQQGVAALAEVLAPVDLVGAQSGRRWDGGLPLTSADHGGATIWADADPLDQIVVTVAGAATHTPTEIGALVPIGDQTPFESSSSAAYNRTLTSDGDCWVAQTCVRLSSDNEIHRQNILVNVWYEAKKDFRWIEMASGELAMISRSWLEAPFVGVSGNNTIEQFTSLEVKLPDGSGGSIQYTTIWGVIEPPLGEVVVSNSTANGIDEGWENTDAWLDAN